MVRKAKAKIPRDKELKLSEIMEKVHTLADYAWPRNASGVSAMPEDALRLIIDIQEQACKAARAFPMTFRS